MKNYEAIIDALKAGETLISDRGGRAKLDGGVLYDDSGNMAFHSFTYPEDWQIHKEPKWYENIPDGDVLCRVCEQEDWDEFEDTPRIITEFKDGMFYDSDGLGWPYVERLTKQEIQVFMDNAPEDL